MNDGGGRQDIRPVIGLLLDEHSDVIQSRIVLSGQKDVICRATPYREDCLKVIIIIPTRRMEIVIHCDNYPV